MNLSLVKPVLSGFLTAYEAHSAKKNESSYLAGANYYLLGVSQSLALASALSFADRSLKIINNSSNNQISRLTYYSISLSPLLINFFNSRINEKSHPTIRRSLYLATSQINNMCHLVTVISAISLVRFNQSALGLSCLASYSVGLAASNHILGQRVANYYDHIGKIGTILQISNPKSYISLVLSLISLFNYASYLLSGNILASEPSIDIPRQRESCIPIENAMIAQNFELDKEHFRFNVPLPKPPETDPEDLLQLFSSFDLKQKSNYLHIHTTITNDQHWKKNNSSDLEILQSVEEKVRKGNPLNKEEQDEQNKLIEYTKQGLSKMINNITKAKISTGTIHDYKPLKVKLKFITENIKQEEMPVFQFEALLRLAISSYYCAGEHLGAIEDEFKACNIDNEHIQNKFIKSLIDIRLKCMDAFIADLERKPGELSQSGLFNYIQKNDFSLAVPTSWGEYFFGSKDKGVDRHLYDEYVAIFADTFEVSHHSFKDLETKMQDPTGLSFCNLLSRHYPQFKQLKTNFFNKFYSIEKLIEYVNTFDKENHQLYMSTWKKWYQDSNPNETDQQAEKWVQDSVYNVWGKTRKKCARYFLYRMGILKL